MFPGQTVPSDCQRFAVRFDVWAWGVSRARRVCLPGVGSQIGLSKLITGRVSIGDYTCQWRHGKPDQKKYVFNFFRKLICVFAERISKGSSCQNLGASTFSWSRSLERSVRTFRDGWSMFPIYTGCKDFRRGVMWQKRGKFVTTGAEQFCIPYLQLWYLLFGDIEQDRLRVTIVQLATDQRCCNCFSNRWC